MIGVPPAGGLPDLPGDRAIDSTLGRSGSEPPPSPRRCPFRSLMMSRVLREGVSVSIVSGCEVSAGLLEEVRLKGVAGVP